MEITGTAGITAYRMTKMKILWFPRLISGIDDLHMTTWKEMSAELIKKGHKVKIALAGYDDACNIENRVHIRIINRKILRMISFWISGYLRFMIDIFRFRPDAVILDIYTVWFAGALPVFLRNTIFILDNRTPIVHNSEKLSYAGYYIFRDHVLEKYSILAHRYSGLMMDGITAITGYYRDYLIKRFRYDRDRVSVFSSGVNQDKFRAMDGDRARPAYLKGRFVFIHHGEISFNRGIIETAAALESIDNEEITLLLLGKGPADSHIKDMIRDKKLENRVLLLPPVPYEDVPGIISYCDCAVMAYPPTDYWNKNNPIKLLEYLASGKPVICTDFRTFRDVAGDKKCIKYIKDNSPLSIRDAMIYLYKNRKLLGEWGKEGIKVVSKNFTWERQAGDLVGFILKLKQGKKKR